MAAPRILHPLMTNEELLQDLKQFVTATVSQTVSQVVSQSEQKINARLESLEDRVEAGLSDLDAKIDTVHDAIADTFTRYTESTDGTLKDHEKRLHRLERRAM
jgi:DNA anti-recombination protein RmuC